MYDNDPTIIDGRAMPVRLQPCPHCLTGEIRWTTDARVVCAACRKPVGSREVVVRPAASASGREDRS